MDHIIHHPWEIKLGPLNLTGFGIAVLMAFVIAQIITQRELTRRGHDAEAQAIPDLIFASVLGMLLGGKLYYILVITHDWRDFFTRAGFVFWGGLIGGVILCWTYITRRKLSFPRFADVAGPAIAGAYAVGRTGCWAVGDDYGRPWASRFAVAFPEGAPPSSAGIMNRMFGTPLPPGATSDTILAVHPTQLYEVAMAVVMFLVIWRYRDHKHAEGWLFGLYCVLAGLERFIVEFFRAKDDRFFGPLTMAQVIALAFMAGGALWMALRWTPGEGKPGIHARPAAA
ncbi:MAG TPA: prolipoprotein diacylglyceryl transferase [Gemmatimonadaceae bacterium]|nr:prolipoprotein diacylglyceryl transferase [Gemmatimonadaceae bacterium]